MYLHGMCSGRLRAGAGRVLRLGGGAVGVGDHPADHPVAGRAAGLRRAATWPTGTTCTCGPTACTSTSAWRRTGCAAWSSSVSASTAPRSWSPSPTATGSRPSRGPTCCATCAVAGMRAPVLAVGDGALGFWAALRDVFPETRAQRCWVHKVANVLDALPKSVQPTARRMLAEIRDAEDRDHAVAAIERVRRRVRRQVAQGGRQDRRRPRAAARLLRLPGRALDPPQDHEPDRVDVRDGAAAHQGHQGPRLAGGRAGDGVQAHRGRPGPLAGRQRPAPRRPRPSRRHASRRG